jgi:hypothetical protein
MRLSERKQPRADSASDADKGNDGARSEGMSIGSF